MIPNDELRELQLVFEPLRQARQAHLKKLEKLRREFVKRFPPSKISQLTLEQYVQGKGNMESFCYWVERKTEDLGHIQGTPAIKFGVYFNKKKNIFLHTKKFKSADDAIVRLRGEITRLLTAAQKRDLDQVRAVDISPMFKGKLLSLYYPDVFINIFSERHVDYYLRELRLNDPGADLDLVSKKERLVDFKNSDVLMQAWRMDEFSRFLYSTWHPPSRDDKIPKILKEYNFDIPPPEKTRPEFILLELGVTPISTKTTSPNNSGQIDFEQKNRRNKVYGNQGEDVVFRAERDRLIKNGKINLANKVKAICRENDSAGYDILSFEIDGTPKYIEVKSTPNRQPRPNSSFQFRLSANEYEQAKRLPNFHLFIVFEVTSKKTENLANSESGQSGTKASGFETGELLRNAHCFLNAMINNEAQLKQAIEQIQGLCHAIESLRADIFPKSPRNFAILAEGPVDEIRKLQVDIDSFINRLEAVA